MPPMREREHMFDMAQAMAIQQTQTTYSYSDAHGNCVRPLSPEIERRVQRYCRHPWHSLDVVLSPQMNQSDASNVDIEFKKPRLEFVA